MPTLTSNFEFQKPLVNNATDADLWGGQLNTNWDDLDTDLALTTSAKSSDFNVGATEFNYTYTVDTSGGNVTASLPAVANVFAGFTVRFKVTDATNDLIIDGSGSETIDGATTLTLSTLYDSTILICDGTEWFLASSATSIASDAEVRAGTEGSKAIAPKFYGDNSSFSSTEIEYEFPAGLKMKTGVNTPSSFSEGVSNNVTFSNAFDTACVSVMLQHQMTTFMGSDSNTAVVLKSAPAKTGFTYYFDPVSGTPSGKVYWTAFGY